MNGCDALSMKRHPVEQAWPNIIDVLRSSPNLAVPLIGALTRGSSLSIQGAGFASAGKLPSTTPGHWADSGCAITSSAMNNAAHRWRSGRTR
jgi:hypothetical protein